MEKINSYIRSVKNSGILIPAAAIVVLITIAAALFLFYGKNNTITIEEAEASTETTKLESTEQSEQSAPTQETAGTVYVDVSGCVKKPGVYEVPSDSRIFEVIEKAGGVTSDADTSSINQAEPVSDGLKINVPDKNDASSVLPYETASQSSQENGKININTADSTLLQTIPGVGPATAEKIISYRETTGSFKKPEDIKNVSGIGDKTYEKMKDMICVTGGAR